MTGQAKRKNSMYQQTETPPDSRKNSNDSSLHTDLPIEPTIDNSDDGVNTSIEELVKYSARKFSIFVPANENERTILDDLEYFRNKKECDYGMCKCCRVQKKQLQTDWKSIEEIIENDPEIIFDSDDNPIVVKEPSILNPIVGISKKMHLEKLPGLFKTIYEKLSDPPTT